MTKAIDNTQQTTKPPRLQALPSGARGLARDPGGCRCLDGVHVHHFAGVKRRATSAILR
jgi:hypothetical protein